MIEKVGKYYLSDLRWYIINKYPELRHSFYYEFQRDSFLEMIKENDSEFLSLAKLGIKNCVEEDLKLAKRNMKDDPDRMMAAATCLALIDLVA